jgi:Heavy metal associated domain 2
MKKENDSMKQYYVHHIPGRLRIRIASLRNNPRQIDTVRTLLDVNGAEKIRVNPLTGSVVVTYDPEAISGQALLGMLEANDFFHEDRSITLDAQLQQASTHAARKVGRAMFGWAVGRVLEANGLALLAAFI